MNCVPVMLPPRVQIAAPWAAPVLLRNWLEVTNTALAMTAPPLINALLFRNTLSLVYATVALTAPPLAFVQHTELPVIVTLVSFAVAAARPPPDRSLIVPLLVKTVPLAITVA